MEEHWKKVILSKPVIDDSAPTDYLKSEKVRQMKRTLSQSNPRQREKIPKWGREASGPDRPDSSAHRPIIPNSPNIADKIYQTEQIFWATDKTACQERKQDFFQPYKKHKPDLHARGHEGAREWAFITYEILSQVQ